MFNLNKKKILWNIPQLSPMLWLILMFFFFLNFLITVFKLYYL